MITDDDVDTKAMKVWTVYILKLSDGSYYTGITLDIFKRLKAHNSGKGSKCVRAHLPCEVVWIDCISGKSNALKLEASIKKLSHAKKEKMIAERNKW